MSSHERQPDPSETSPLLSTAASSSDTVPRLHSGKSTSAPVPGGTGSVRSPTGNGVSPGVNVAANPRDDGGASERQSDSEIDREGQIQGMPEVKKQLKYILPAVSIGIFLAAADQSLVASSAGKIGSDLSALDKSSWIATSYFLTLTSFQPLYGKLSDIFGRKACLLSAYTIFAFGCLWCGLSRSMNEFIAARALSGVGGGGMTTVVAIMMSDIVPLRERGTWQGILNIIYATGAGVGAPLGGALCDSIGWQWAFKGQFPLCVVAFICVAVTLKLPKIHSDNWKTNLRRVDFVGALVLVAAVSTLLLGLDRGSNQSWSAPITIACLGTFVPLFATFVLVEQKVAIEPFAPGRIIFERSLFASYLCNFFSFAGWLGLIVFTVPLYYQAVLAVSATQAGIRLLPGIVSSVTGSLLGGLIMQKTGKYRWLTIGAYALLTIGGFPILFFSGAASHSTLAISIGLAIGGLGIGIGVTTSLIALIANAEPEDQAIATACSYLFRSLGSVVGLSLQSALFQGVLRVRLEERLSGEEDAGELVRRIRESLDYVKTLEPDVQQVAREAYGNASKCVFALVIVTVSGALISSFFIREKRLSR